MHSIKKTILAVCVILLSGCTTLSQDIDTYFGDDDRPRETVYSYSEPEIGMNYTDMAREMTSGSVQVYGLDGPVPEPQHMLSVGHDGGIPSSVDPNVTVYPLFAGTLEAEPAEARPVLRPPSAEFRPLESPFGGPLQTPAPVPLPQSASPVFQPPAPVSAPYEPASGVSRIYFNHGSSTLNQTGEQVVDFVGRNKSRKIVVEGHASERTETNDPVESKIVNLKMSMDRAFKVSSELIRDGVPLENIETRAYGDARPSEYVPGAQGEAANRRVEIRSELVPANSVHSFVPVPMEPAPIPPLVRY